MNTLPSTQHLIEATNGNDTVFVVARFDSNGRRFYSQDGCHWGTLLQSFAHVDRGYIDRCKIGHVTKAWF